MRQSFLQNGAQKYNGERSSLSGWFSTPQGAYVLGWELAQFDSAVDDVFGYRAVQVGLPEVDFLRQNRIPFRASVALEPGAAIAADPLQLPLASQSVDLIAQEILERIQSMVQGVQIRGPFAHYETPLQVLSVMMKGASR